MQLMNRVNRVLHIAGVVSCALFMASCAATQALHGALTGQQNTLPPNDPIHGPGMTLYSPDETGWYRAPRRQNEFSLVKPGRVQGETYAFMVDALKLGPGENRADLVAKYEKWNQ